MNHERALYSSVVAGLLGVVAAWGPARRAEAQPAPKAAPTSASTAAPISAPAARTAPGPAPVAVSGPAPVAVTAPVSAPAPESASPDALAEALGPQKGGLTPDEAGKAALTTRPSVRVKEAELTAAAARVDQALISYYPKLSVSATYTRSSPIESSLSLGSFEVVRADTASTRLTAKPCAPTGPDKDTLCVFDANDHPVSTSHPAINIPPIVSSYAVVASISLPVSDWVLRASQGLAAAAHAESAKKIELEAEKLQVAADAKITYFNWVRAKGQVSVAIGAVAQSNAHLDDARRVESVGFLSRADVLRLEAQVASAELVQSEAEAFAAIAERQLRQAIGAPPDKPLAIGIDVLREKVAPETESLDALIQRAAASRLEIRALDETQFALKNNESVTKAGYFPKVEAFADGTLANPNARIFPQQPGWDFTWDAGLRVTWVVSDTFATAPAVAEAKARTAAVAAQRTALREALELEVAMAYSDMKRALLSIEAAERGLAAAEESLRVRSEQFRSGKVSSVDLIDAETEVTRDRLHRLDAHVGLLVAKTRLDHASGRDAKEAGAVK